MKIIITGMPYFAKKMQKQLSAFDKDNTYIYLNTFYSKIDKLKYIFYLINADVVYMHGGSICCSGVINLALKFNKRVIVNWAGTDVLTALNQVEFKKNYTNRIEHYCVAPWLLKELKTIGVNAKILDITVIQNKNEIYELPKTLTFLSYVGKDRPIFYGINTLIKLAKDFPNINFRVSGIEEYSNIPKNMKLLGWIDMDQEYKNALVYIRAPEHDGMPFSVLEALSYGKIVFYNYEFRYTNFFKDYSDLKQQLAKTIDDFYEGKLSINQEAIDYVQTEFSEDKVLGQLVKVFIQQKFNKDIDAS